jgi:quercetin dioxygenase-like cupin family protein
MSRVLELSSLEWQAVRPQVARQVFGKTLRDDKVKAVLTRVAPEGRFEVHSDPYAHLFYFLGGEGRVWIGNEQFAAHAGVVVQIDAGEEHAYENTGSADLMLLSLNIPVA